MCDSMHLPQAMHGIHRTTAASWGGGAHQAMLTVAKCLPLSCEKQTKKELPSNQLTSVSLKECLYALGCHTLRELSHLGESTWGQSGGACLSLGGTHRSTFSRGQGQQGVYFGRNTSSPDIHATRYLSPTYFFIQMQGCCSTWHICWQNRGRHKKCLPLQPIRTYPAHSQRDTRDLSHG